MAQRYFASTFEVKKRRYKTWIREGKLNQGPTLVRTRERNFSAHHMLIRAADRSMESVEKEEPGWFYDALTTMTFSALAVEAICNSVGDRVIPHWGRDFDQCQPMTKMRILANHMGIDFDLGKEPWQGAKWLISFRNLVAHAKPEVLRVEDLITREEYDKKLFDTPESKLEVMITAAAAQRAVNVARALKEVLIEKIPLDSADGLALDSWHGSATIAP